MRLKTTLLGAAAALVLSAGVASAATVTEGLNLRSGPGTGYSVIDTLPAGAQVSVLTCGGSWCRVDWRGEEGYASRSYLGGVGYAYTEPYYEYGYGPNYAYGDQYPYYDDYGPGFVFGYGGGYYHHHHFHHRGHFGGGQPGRFAGGIRHFAGAGPGPGLHGTFGRGGAPSIHRGSGTVGMGGGPALHGGGAAFGMGGGASLHGGGGGIAHGGRH